MGIVIYKPGEDIPFTADQLYTLCLPETSVHPEDFLEAGWVDSRYGIFYVEEGLPIGVAFCGVSEDDGTHMYLYTLCVSEAGRNRRYGLLLLSEVEKLARQLNLTGIDLNAIADKQPFYEKGGFKVVGVEDDGFVPMKKTLSGGSRRTKTRRSRRKKSRKVLSRR